MFCSNCGNEIKDGEAFCPKCGAKTGADQANPGKQRESLHTGNGSGKKIMDNLQVGLESLGENRMWYFACLILQIVCMIFLALPMFRFEVDAYFVQETMTATLFEGKNLALALALILYCISIVFILLPMVFGREWKRSGFLFCVALSAVSIVYFIVDVIMANINMKEEYGDYLALADVHFSVTAEGWAFLVLCLCAIIAAYTNWCYADGFESSRRMAKKRRGLS